MGNKARCERCQLHLELCACSLMPQFDLPTQLLVLLHAQELKKPSNTGQLAARILKNSEIRIRGSADRTPLNLEGLFEEKYQTVLLALHPDAEELNADYVAKQQKPIKLVVPDGTWTQASRLASKLQKKFPQLKMVKLQADTPSIYRLRTEHDPNGMATFEAIARALGVLEGSDVREEMEKFFRIFSDRMLYSRGKLKKDEVWGGVPHKPVSAKS